MRCMRCVILRAAQFYVLLQDCTAVYRMHGAVSHRGEGCLIFAFYHLFRSLVLAAL